MTLVHTPSSRTVVGSLVALGTLAALSAVMFAFRSHIDVATVGLVLIIPVVVGVVTGGAVAGSIAVVAGFVVYDIVFIPPYGTLAVGRAENWVPLVVYVLVMALVTRVASGLAQAEAIAQSRTADAERLFVLSELLVGERPLPELLELIVSTVYDAFEVGAVVLLMPDSEELRPVASAGRELSPEELVQLTPSGGVLVPFSTWHRTATGAPEGTRTIVLSATGRPVGLLALVGLRPPLPGKELLATFTNHIALAVERAQLREQAVRMGILEEVDRLRRALIGTVSHDLRTPLATIKASTSALRDPEMRLGEDDSRELLALIETQTDRLTRLVSNLLDMSRIQSGSLVPDVLPTDVRDLASEAVSTLGPDAAARVRVAIPADIPQVEVDHVFITEALVNLLENALRFGPPESPVVVDAVPRGAFVVVRVSDSGPGVAPADRDHVFERAARVSASGASTPTAGTGVGLTIVRSFVEAHGGRVFVEDAEGGGARFGFEVPATAPTSARVPR